MQAISQVVFKSLKPFFPGEVAVPCALGRAKHLLLSFGFTMMFPPSIANEAAITVHIRGMQL